MPVCSTQVPLCVLDNWALIHAQQLAVKEKLPLHVCVCLHVPKSELSTLRHYSFMLKGLEEVAKVHKDCADETRPLKVAPIAIFSPLLQLFRHLSTGMQSLRCPVPPATRSCGRGPSRFCVRAPPGGRGDGFLPPQRAVGVVGGSQEGVSKGHSPHTGQQFCKSALPFGRFLGFLAA